MNTSIRYDICFCCSTNMLVHVVEVINNLVEVCPETAFTMHVIIGAPEEVAEDLTQLLNVFGSNVDVIVYSGDVLDEIILNDHILRNKNILLYDTKCIYYKLFIHRFIDSSIKHVLYLDYDVYISSSKILDIFNIDLGHSYLAGAIDLLTVREDYASLHLTNTYQSRQYIDTGVMLLDLAKIRNDSVLDKQITTFMHEIPDQFLDIWDYDQTIINFMLCGKIKTLSNIYNLVINDYCLYQQSILSNKAWPSNALVGLNEIVVFQYAENKPWTKDYDIQSIWHSYILKRYLANRRQTIAKHYQLIKQLSAYA